MSRLREAISYPLVRLDLFFTGSRMASTSLSVKAYHSCDSSDVSSSWIASPMKVGPRWTRSLPGPLQGFRVMNSQGKGPRSRTNPGRTGSAPFPSCPKLLPLVLSRVGIDERNPATCFSSNKSLVSPSKLHLLKSDLPPLVRCPRSHGAKQQGQK